MLLTLMSAVYSAYPQFEYDDSSSQSGIVDIKAKSSSATQVELYINENYVGEKDIYADPVEVVLDGSEISDVSVPLGANVVFKNDADDKIYQLNISNGPIETLSSGDMLTYQVTELGDIEYTNELSGATKTISVTDSLVSFNFSDVNEFLSDGQNDIKFVQKYPFPIFEKSQEYQNVLNFNKYPNSINVDDYPNVTQSDKVVISGSVGDSKYPLYYTKNLDPKTIGNQGALNSVDLKGSLFNFTISGLREGENDIYFVTTEPSNNDLYTAYEKIQIILDTISPEIDINSVKFKSSQNGKDVVLSDLKDEDYVNSNSLILNITTDASTLNYTLNNKSYSAEVKNNVSIVDLSLREGDNRLVLMGIDEAGNIKKQAHNIKFDNSPPELIDDSLEPEEMFDSGVARFFFQEIEGKTNKGDVRMTVFTLPYDAEDKDGNPITCDKYKDLFIRNLGQLDGERPDYPELNLNETQISLTNYMFQKTTVTSDSNGNFDAIIGLQEKNFDYSDYRDARDGNPQVDSVQSRNTICFLMSDKYGNVGVDSKRVTLDAGNTMWKPSEITTIPNTLYAAEIENAGDVRSGRGNVEFAVIARFQYIGPEMITHLTSLNIREDAKTSKHSKYARVDTSRMNFRLDKDTGELIVHFPVKISPMDKDPLKYPDELKFAFKADVKYSVGDKQIPIDEKNPIYFQTSVNIESPLDHTKWLTPETIDKWLGYLNKTIDFTETAVDWTGKASVVGVLGCTATKFWYGIQAATYGDDEDKLEEAKKKMFMVCDRVACTASPKKCEGDFLNLEEGGNGIFHPEDPNDRHFSGSELEGDARIRNNEQDEEVLAQFDTLRFQRPCDYNGDGDNSDGVIVTGKVTKYERDEGVWDYETTSQGLVDDMCVPAKVNKADSNDWSVDAVNLQSASGACFVEGKPKYDETRCNFFGADPSGVPGWDPSDNVIESIRCGCVTDTYSHLKNYLKIMKAIRGCLEQARIGETKGSYCERLLSQAVCDIATNVMFNTISQKSTRTGSDGQDPHENPILQGIQGLKDGDKILNDRYKGTFYSKAGLGSQQIVNKACMVAFTGDWSMLSENILSSIDQNEVEPVFGPSMPVSRLQGYNPITGDLSVMYRFTHAVVSGGQHIRTKVEFICDSQSPGGEHCPRDYATSNNPQMGSDFSTKTLYVRADGSAQDTVVVTDTSARYRYNILKLTHEYSLNGDKKERVVEERIFHKGEKMLANCYFSAGALGAGSGFKCDTLFDNDALLSAYTINKQSTKLVPNSGAIYFPGNDVYLNLGYDVRADEFNSQNSFDLAYVATCPGKDDGKAIKKGVKSVNLGQGVINSGQELADLFKIPQIGEIHDSITTTYSVQVDESFEDASKNNKVVIRFTNTQGTSGQEFKIKSTDLQNVGSTSVNVGHNLIVNDGGESAYEDVSLGTMDGSGLSPDKYDLVLEGEIASLDVKLIVLGPSGEIKKEKSFVSGRATDTNLEYTFDKLQEGTCELEIKILPDGKGQEAIADISQFKDYSPLSENIQTDSNSASKDYHKMSFKVSQKPDEQHFAFELVEPYESGSYCVESADASLPIKYVLQTSNNEDLDKAKLDYVLSVPGYTVTSEGLFDLTENALKEESLSISEIARSLSGKGGEEVKLTYDLITKKKGEVQEENKDSNSINFYLEVPKEGESCYEVAYEGSSGSDEEENEAKNTDELPDT